MEAHTNLEIVPRVLEGEYEVVANYSAKANPAGPIGLVRDGFANAGLEAVLFKSNTLPPKRVVHVYHTNEARQTEVMVFDGNISPNKFLVLNYGFVPNSSLQTNFEACRLFGPKILDAIKHDANLADNAEWLKILGAYFAE